GPCPLSAPGFWRPPPDSAPPSSTARKPLGTFPASVEAPHRGSLETQQNWKFPTSWWLRKFWEFAARHLPPFHAPTVGPSLFLLSEPGDRRRHEARQRARRSCEWRRRVGPTPRRWPGKRLRRPADESGSACTRLAPTAHAA